MPGDASVTGRIFDIQKFSVHDGPGIRTLVFFKGCPLQCSWCSNPEGISSETTLFWARERCISCGACVEVCHHGVHRLVETAEGQRQVLDRTASCQGCGQCVAVCPTGALRSAGREVSVREVMDDVVKDSAFYANSGGGLTLGGGEPTHQPEFAQQLLMAAKREQIHTAMETCAFTPWENFERLLPLLDLLLVDIKHMESQAHVEITGVSNGLILDNIRRLLRANVPVIVRLPLVPGVSDGESLRSALDFVRRNDREGLVQRIDIIPYHRWGVEKYARLGLNYTLDDVREPSREEMVAAAELAATFGYPIRIQAAA
jgi:choline trimethylamine-lyase activating enzyme